MNITHKHTEAANFLLNHAIPSEEKIDAMSEAELTQFLADSGVDLPSLKADMATLKTKLSGKMAMAQARQARLAKTQTSAPVDVSSLTQEQIIEALTSKYGRVEDIPLAARNFKSLGRQDWESLYKDLICRCNKDRPC